MFIADLDILVDMVTFRCVDGLGLTIQVKENGLFFVMKNDVKDDVEKVVRHLTCVALDNNSDIFIKNKKDKCYVFLSY